MSGASDDLSAGSKENLSVASSPAAPAGPAVGSEDRARSSAAASTTTAAAGTKAEPETEIETGGEERGAEAEAKAQLHSQSFADQHAAGEQLPMEYDHVLGELEALLSKRRKDEFAVRQLCRRLGTLPSTIRKKVYPILLGVSHSDVSISTSLSAAGDELEDYHVIQGDVARTRRTLAFFKDEEVQGIMVNLLMFYCKRRGTPYTQGMNEVLAAFINLFVDELSEDRSAKDVLVQHQALIFNCFYAFMGRFLATSFRNDDFRTLKCSLVQFSLLLRFHDPRLANFLAQFAVDPELFAMSWFLTAFAHGTQIGTVERVWDTLIISDDPTLLHFIAVSTIMHFREDLLTAQTRHDSDGTMDSLRDCVFEELLQVKDRVKQDASLPMLTICRRAAIMSRRTPRTYHARVKAMCFETTFEPSSGILEAVRQQMHVFISTKDFVAQLLRQQKSTTLSLSGNGAQCHQTGSESTVFAATNAEAYTSVKYFVLDCRPEQAFRSECIVTSLNLAPTLLANGGVRCNSIVESLRAMLDQGCVFCFLDSDEACALARKAALKPSATSDSSGTANALERMASDSRLPASTNDSGFATPSQHVAQWLLFLSQRGISRCAVVDGGFAECRSLATAQLKKCGRDIDEIYHSASESDQGAATTDQAKSNSATDEVAKRTHLIDGEKAKRDFEKIGRVFQLGFQNFQQKIEEFSKNLDEEMQRSADLKGRKDPEAARRKQEKKERKARRKLEKQAKKERHQKKQQQSQTSGRPCDVSANAGGDVGEKPSMPEQPAIVSLSSVMRDPSAQIFKAFECENGIDRGRPCFLALTTSRLQCLVTTDQQRGECNLVLDVPLASLKKLALAKSKPELVKFHFSSVTDGDEVVAKRAFLLPERKNECVQAVQHQFHVARQQQQQQQQQQQK